MIRPILDRVVLRRLEQQDKTPGGIIMPAVAQEKNLEALVVAAGPGKFVGESFVETTVKKGDKVLVGKFSGLELKYEDVDYVVVREEEIIAVIT